MADPATMAALASLGGQLIGGKQIGAPAPAPQLGGGPLLGRNPLEVMQQQTPPDLLTPPSMAGMLGEAPPADTTSDEQVGGFDKFFNNLDSTLNSPSKALGLGLLGRVNPALGVGGLLMSGFGGPQGTLDAVKSIPGAFRGLLG